MKVVILVNGEYGSYDFWYEVGLYDFCICADNGLHHAKHLGIKPDLIMGDFDSADDAELQFFETQGVKIQRFNPRKDATDTELAVEYAIELGADEVVLCGGIGSRFDHSLANIYLLNRLLKHHIKGSIINDTHQIYLISDQIMLKGSKGTLISLLPFTEQVTGVTTYQLGYPLNRAVLTRENALGVSNYFEEETAGVSIQSGVLMVLVVKEK